MEENLQELVALGCFIVFSTAFAFAAIIMGFVLSPKAGNDAKNKHYECGMQLYSDAKIQYNARFFVYAILFLIFDIETILLFPFAVTYNQLGIFAFFEVAIFVLILLLGLYYAAKKKLLKWR